MRGRFAPSPTGPLHLGNLRTALAAWLFARSAGSELLLRVEDLDPVAARREVEESQLADLAALGLDHDGPVVRQSERMDLYHAAIAVLEDRGLTYRCWCSRREVQAAAAAPHEHLPEGAYAGTCRDLSAAEVAEREASGRPAALRLLAGGPTVTVVDALAGPVTMVVDDFVVRRGDGTPAYNLAVLVDDDAQQVEQVVRGDDLLAGTPRQVHLARLLGLSLPAYAHVPLVLGPDGERLAKRHGSVTLTELADAGIAHVEVLSRLAESLGLAGRGETVTPDALVRRFDPDLIPTEPWVVDPSTW